MFRNIINAITSATRTFFGNGKTAVVIIAIYAALVVALYLFFTTPEARMWQVALTMLLLLAIPVLFFVLQAMGVNYTNTDNRLSALLTQAGRDFWKLLLISLPFIALVWFLIWGVNKLEFMGVTGIREAATSSEQVKSGEGRIKLINTVAFAVNALLMYFVLPLLSIQLWIAVLRDGFKQTLKSLLRVLVKAFAPRLVLTYLLGFVVFGVLPYYLVTTRTPLKSPWVDLTVLGLRIGLALLVIIVGWVVTVGSLKLLATENTERTET